MRGRPVQSSPSSDSQDDLADTEMDDKGNRQPETNLTTAPPKKKRTRTLTTPHQSAVLYALLAQSRFPSTAVREEVGRSIGLSARKVQIWFQNQRQKARRPQNQTDASRRRAQEPTISGASSTSRNGPYLFPDPGTTSRMTESPVGTAFDLSSHRGYHSDSPAQLSGPGMPGSDPQMGPRYSGRPILPLIPESTIPRPSSSPYLGSNQHRPRLSRSPSLESPTASRPTTTSRLHDRHFSRTLPPLITTNHTRSSFSPANLYPTTLRSTNLSQAHLQPLSPDTPFAHHPPSHESLTLPPPYGLQRNPHWQAPLPPVVSPTPDEQPPANRSPPSRCFTPHNHGPKDSPSLRSPMSATHQERGRSSPTAESPLPPRGRYDPVRGTFISTASTEAQSSLPRAGTRSPKADD